MTGPYSWLAGRLVRKAYADLSRHDMDAVLALFADDGVFHFPGDHALGGEYRGKAQIRGFFERLWSAFPRLTFEVQDIAVKGPPWDMRLCVRYRDQSRAGALEWGGEGVQFAYLSWGKLRADYIHNDTLAVERYLQRLTELDPSG